MPVNASWGQCYIDESCYLICKNNEGYFDLGTAQQLNPDSCLAAKTDWANFVAQYGSQYGIGEQDGTNSQTNGTDNENQTGGGLFSGGLFNWIGFGLVGKGKGNPPPPKPIEWLLIGIAVLGVLVIIEKIKA